MRRCFLAALCAALLLTVSYAQAQEPFSARLERKSVGSVVDKWSKLQTKLIHEQPTLRRCVEHGECSSVRMRTFAKIIRDTRSATDDGRIGRANRAVRDLISYMSDQKQYGIEDHWASPSESIENGKGDCEDYAIALYVVLREAGTPEEDLRFIIGWHRASKTDHAVLAVRDQDRQWRIADNLTNLTMLKDSQVTALEPIYAFKEHGVYRFLSDRNAPTVSFRINDVLNKREHTE